MTYAGDPRQYLDHIETMKEEVGRRDPEFLNAWSPFNQQAMKHGALSVKQKELIAVALAVANHCGYCIASHVKKCVDLGLSRAEILEAGFVAVSMGGGPSLGYLTQVIEASCDEFGVK